MEQTVLTMQDALTRLAEFWTAQGCLLAQPMNTEVGAGTVNPATFLRVLGPEPWRVAYVEPSVRPDDSRYGENPNRVQTHTQYQVILKPEPGDAQELYLRSLTALGIDIHAHDVRFVEDNWASPALGAWGLGWEVWLDGLEITQFTYFQQAGGVNLDPVSVEITYGMERILMALQGVRHFKEIAYTDAITYGEVFGQAEYEMSRYYLDDADVSANRTLLGIYAAEAQRMVDLRLPVPAHTYVLKCSHAFNVLDARGAISTADRATEFGRMRRLAAAVSQLWIARREELGHPLGVSDKPQPAATATVQAGPGTGAGVARRLVLEVGVEEMPPAEARTARQQLERELTERLAAARLDHGGVRVLATPRRLVGIVDDVAARENDHTSTVKGPRTSAAYANDGTLTKAALGFARAQQVDPDHLQRADIGGVEHLVVTREVPGRAAVDVLAGMLGEVVGSLRSSKNMRWRDPGLSFTRPIRWLLALWGDDIVPVRLSTLAAGRATWVHRDADVPELAVSSAEAYEDLLADAGIVTDPQLRRQQIVTDARGLAASVGGRVDTDAESALIDQIAYLVEQPTPLVGGFDASYLDLPQQVLATVMRKHQRYLPILDADGRLMPYFVVVANGRVDADVVRAGNEAVLRARYEDAAFFFRADQATPLATLRAKLDQLTFTDQLGSMRDRADRIAALATTLASMVKLSTKDRSTIKRAGALVKFDLGSQLVAEMTSLAGIMAREYALNAGEPPLVAQALYETELPRQTGDAIPDSLPGAALALADRIDMLVGLATTVGVPTGSSDPFALRRAALGVIAICRAHGSFANLSLTQAYAAAAELQPVMVPPAALEDLATFVVRRLEQLLAEEGQPVDWVRAVLRHADRPHRTDEFLSQLRELIGQEDFRAVAEALQRCRRIVPADTLAAYDPDTLTEPAERRLHEALTAARGDLEKASDLSGSATAFGWIVKPINDFFDEVFVMADDRELRRARLGLLATIRDLSADALDWEQLRL
jgi:glycyl-tRNA synthetase